MQGERIWPVGGATHLFQRGGYRINGRFLPSSVPAPIERGASHLRSNPNAVALRRDVCREGARRQSERAEVCGGCPERHALSCKAKISFLFAFDRFRELSVAALLRGDTLGTAPGGQRPSLRKGKPCGLGEASRRCCTEPESPKRSELFLPYFQKSAIMPIA
jgi:hypothetical protein